MRIDAIFLQILPSRSTGCNEALKELLHRLIKQITIRDVHSWSGYRAGSTSMYCAVYSEVPVFLLDQIAYAVNISK